MKRKQTNDEHDINDVEILGYLHSKKETQLKKVIWEFIQEKQLKMSGQLPKRGEKKEEEGLAKKATKITGGVGRAKSSKINYDALGKAMEENEDNNSREVSNGGKSEEVEEEGKSFGSSGEEDKSEVPEHEIISEECNYDYEEDDDQDGYYNYDDDCDYEEF